MKKRFLCMLLALLVAAALLPLTASAYGDVSTIVIKDMIGPIAGEHPCYTVGVNSNRYSAEVVGWYRMNESQAVEMASSETFARDTGYLVLLRVDPVGGTHLEDDTSKLSLSTLNCTMPTDYRVSFTPKVNDDSLTFLLVAITFDAPLVNKGEKVSRIVINGLKTPEAGKHPDTEIINPNDNIYYLGSAMGWLEDGSTGFMTEDGVFRAGTAYYVGFNAVIRDGYYFDLPDNIQAEVNGKVLTDGVTVSTTGTGADSRMLFIRYYCPGWAKNADEKWTYYSESGQQTGWQKISSKWYYLGTDGVMVTGWKQISGKWYYMNSSGVMQTGWVKSGGKWYYMNSAGAMQTGWQKTDGKWYWLGTDGAMATGWLKIDGVWYYFESGGAMVTGWKQVSGKWYYFASSGAMRTGWQKISGKWYFFESSGAMKTGWYKENGKWYYLKSSGAMACSESVTVSGKSYSFNSSGVCTNP